MARALQHVAAGRGPDDDDIVPIGEPDDGDYGDDEDEDVEDDEEDDEY